MSQSKTISLIEALLNVGSGLIVSAIIWVVVGPVFGYVVGWADAFGFSAIFTVASICRSYLWRRLFENRLNRWLSNALL